jgi:hypothetical protein
MRAYWKFAAIAAGVVLLVAAGTVEGVSYYYTAQHGQRCGSCHEMAAYVNEVHGSPHRDASCLDCHKVTLATKLRHVRVHLMRNWPEAIRLRDVDVEATVTDCKTCHQREYANWHAGPHSVTYGQIFTNEEHNTKRRLMEDCFRCHGAHFNGSLHDVVQPLGLKGPWRIVRPGFANMPAIPCEACHQVHRQGPVETKPVERISVAGKAVDESLAFYDRREGIHFAAAAMPIPQLYDGAQALKMSMDARQSVCYQCHAPRIAETGTVAAAKHWGMQAGSGDDRTPMGVHEGISCLACHNGHNENARASCKTCHPKMSNCGIDVETMDTTYANAKSLHNIHWVKCTDCHTHGVPKPKTRTSKTGGAMTAEVRTGAGGNG